MTGARAASAWRLSRARLAVAAMVWWLMIAVSIPFGRACVDALRPRGLLTLTVVLASALLALAVGVVAWTLRRRGMLSLRSSATSMAVAMGVLGAAQLLPRAEVRLHVLQYAVLGALVWSIVKGRPLWRGVIAVALVGLAGWVDEIVQYFLPERVYDLNDVLLNLVSGVGGVVAMTAGVLAGDQGAEATR